MCLSNAENRIGNGLKLGKDCKCMLDKRYVARMGLYEHVNKPRWCVEMAYGGREDRIRLRRGFFLFVRAKARLFGCNFSRNIKHFWPRYRGMGRSQKSGLEIQNGASKSG